MLEKISSQKKEFTIKEYEPCDPRTVGCWHIDKEKEDFYISEIKKAKIDNYNFFENENYFKEFLSSTLNIDEDRILVSKGNFDWENRKREVIFATIERKNYRENSFIIIIDDNLNLNIFSSGVPDKESVVFENAPVKILDNYPDFFTIRDHYAGGSCSDAISNKYIYHIENLDLVLSLTLSSLVKGDETPEGYNYDCDCGYRSETFYTYEYNKNHNELIVHYTKEPFEGDEETKEKFRTYYDEKYKWDYSTNKFTIAE